MTTSHQDKGKGGSRQPVIVGLGELLWDCFPDGQQPGGAPANFAFIAGQLGAKAIIASRVGTDEAGAEMLQQLAAKGLDVSFLQHDGTRPTGLVDVAVDGGGQPAFTIHENVAWDYLAWTPEWEKLAQQADAVCFGSLAQRAPCASETIRRFVAATRPDALRFFDVNMRQSFFTPAIIRASLQMADAVKMNHEELPRVAAMLGTGGADEPAQAARLRQEYNLRLVCVTRGARGSLLITPDEVHEQPGLAAVVADTVGAGDAFTATLAYCYLQGHPVSFTNRAANRVAAWVASQPGGMPQRATKEMLTLLKCDS